jgi:hypothetical protein
MKECVRVGCWKMQRAEFWREERKLKVCSLICLGFYKEVGPSPRDKNNGLKPMVIKWLVGVSLRTAGE